MQHLDLEAGVPKGREITQAHGSSTSGERMKTIEASMEDLKAAIAAEIASKFIEWAESKL